MKKVYGNISDFFTIVKLLWVCQSQLIIMMYFSKIKKLFTKLRTYPRIVCCKRSSVQHQTWCTILELIPLVVNHITVSPRYLPVKITMVRTFYLPLTWCNRKILSHFCSVSQILLDWSERTGGSVTLLRRGWVKTVFIFWMTFIQ